MVNGYRSFDTLFGDVEKDDDRLGWGETFDTQNRDEGVVIVGDGNPDGVCNGVDKDDRSYFFGVVAWRKSKGEGEGSTRRGILAGEVGISSPAVVAGGCRRVGILVGLMAPTEIFGGV